MKLSVLLLPALLAMSSGASLQDIVKKSSQIGKVPILNPDLGNRIPQITTNGSLLALPPPAEFENRLGQSSSFVFGDSNLKWQTSSGSLPPGAVSIYNGYAGHTDYVCKYGCASGFYNLNMGPYCYYPLSGKEHRARLFEVLVNKDNLEFLEWKDGSYGSVPQNAVYTCSPGDTYVGRNKYGLGKVHVKHEAFFLPWKGDEYWYKSYQVLTLNKEINSERISNVNYNTNVKVFQHPPETMTKSIIANNECSPVVKRVELSKTYMEEKRWDTSTAITTGVSNSITAQIPFIGSAGITLSVETTLQFSSGTTVVESKTYSVSVEQTVPPNHFCSVRMVGYKYEADIPYTARLSRTYRNGQTTWAYITGTYKGVNIGEIYSVVDRCEPVPNSKPCP
ncbi:natterin-3-like [Perca flavescens]|uniref:natterin-3-like n=1 Tax=Perca flavescens TaxID=8167 RepID=UPI00106E158B|nr:natterin-3-like [Perca flavescens]